jgi:hypothetical protein
MVKNIFNFERKIQKVGQKSGKSTKLIDKYFQNFEPYVYVGRTFKKCRSKGQESQKS